MSNFTGNFHLKFTTDLIRGEVRPVVLWDDTKFWVDSPSNIWDYHPYAVQPTRREDGNINNE